MTPPGALKRTAAPLLMLPSPLVLTHTFRIVTLAAVTVIEPVTSRSSMVVPAFDTVRDPDGVSDEQAFDGPTFAYLGSGYPHAPGEGKQFDVWSPASPEPPSVPVSRPPPAS